MLTTTLTDASTTAVVAAVCLGVLAAAFLLYYVRVTRQRKHLEGVLKALAHGERCHRANLESGPLRDLARELDEYAESVARRFEEYELAKSDLEQLVCHDKLTGTLNRRHFEHQLELEAARSKRYRVPVSTILFEVDDFDHLTEQYGRSVGDRILIDVARRVSSQLRDTDTLARHSDAQYAIIAPCTPQNGAEVIAEKIRHCVNTSSFDVEVPVTISAGVAQLLSGERAKHWLSRADRFLEQAKAAGRNRVCSHTDQQHSTAPFILVWSEQFQTGDAQVDGEHAEIFRLANEIVLLPPDASHQVALTRIDALLAHVKSHFQSEEEHLAQLGCSSLDLHAHAASHQGLLTQATALRRRFAESEIHLDEIGDFIVRRIAIGHLVASDLPLFATLLPNPPAKSSDTDPQSVRLKLHRAFLS